MAENPFEAANRQSVERYSGLLRRHGTSHQALDWGSRQSQERRFAVLSEIGLAKGGSVLDVGCGLGDYCLWLRKFGFDVAYSGVDITPGMIEAAIGQCGAGPQFTCCDILSEGPQSNSYDVVVASGIFAHVRVEPDAFFRAMIARMFDICRHGAAFNSLSAWAPDKDPGEFYPDPVETLSFCRTLTPSLGFRHDYHPRDFTIFLYKETPR